MAQSLVVGRIPFLVCAPFFHQSLEGGPGIEFRDGPPSLQNRWMREGLVDLSPTSSLEYAEGGGGYVLLPGLCTAGRLEIRSVRLFSRLPWKELDGRPVRLSAASATSNALFSILTRRYHGVNPEILPAGTVVDDDELMGQVAIGDEALILLHSGKWPCSFDLAVEWQTWQALPFAFGLWLVRREAARTKTTAVRQYAQELRGSVAAFRKNPALALEAWLKRYPNSLPMDAILDFYSSTDYELTASHLESLRRFFALAHEQGLISKNPDLEFFAG